MSEERRVRTIWVLRERYHRMARIAGFAGAALAGLLVGVLWVAATGSAHPPTARFYLFAVVFVAAAAYLPRWAVIARWHRVRRRYEY